MAATSPSNTARYFLDYTIGGGENRSLQVRYAAPATPADVAAWLEVLLGIVDGNLGTGWAVLGARTAAIGTNVTLPTTAPASPTPGGGTLSPALYPQFVAWQGRDALSGVRAHGSLYGMVINVDTTYRFQRGELTVMDALLDFLQTPVTGVNVSIGANPVAWYDYVNMGFNAYHQRQQRS